MKKLQIKRLFCIISLVAIAMSFSPVSLSEQRINREEKVSSYSISGLSTQGVFWPPNSGEWTEVAPETQGLNSSYIADMFDFIEVASYDIHSVIIVRNGYLLTEEYLQFSQIYTNIDGSKTYPGNETIHMQQSTTKSLISILIGIALQEGFLDNISQTLYEFYAHIWSPNFTNSELKKDITIEQLLTHNSGLGGPSYPPGSKTATEIDCINWALDKVPLWSTPGQAGAYEYNNDGPNLLSGIIANVTGNSTEEFAREYLFTPLGISEDEYYWWHDNQNMSFGGYGFDCSPKVQAKLGILSLNNGNWNGKQIADSNFIKNATSYQISTEFSMGYGYLFYTSGAPYDGYFTYGDGGQSIYVIPQYNIVVGFTGSNLWMEYNTLLVNYILHQITDPPEDNPIPEDPTIPGFDFSMLFLMIFCASAVLIIRRKKYSKN